jgi:sporulation protein YlmC with PRC-barrel domain
LIGYRVYSPEGGSLGQISDLVVNKDDGHIVLVILSDVPGFGSRLAAAPWGAFERIGEHTFQLNFGDREVALGEAYRDRYSNEMERNMDLVGLSDVPGRIDSQWADSLYRFYGQSPYWGEAKSPPADVMSHRVAGNSFSFMGPMAGDSSPPRLFGSMILSNDGEPSGRIIDLVIDSRSGRVALMVLDEVPGRGILMVGVPFGRLSESGNAYVLNVSKEQVATAPAFMGIDGMEDHQKAEEIYRHFGITPYWTMGE